MREDLLHFLWKYQKLSTKNLFGTAQEAIHIVDPGQHNHQAGPDFFNARLQIDGQLWAGNVEMHLKSSDWYAHGHETDPNYNNVILHVVWHDDMAVFRKDGTQIPTLRLKDYISTEVLEKYEHLMGRNAQRFINCETDFPLVDAFLVDSWLDRLFVERLEQKALTITELLKASKNDWEKVLFCLLMKNFGLNINGEVFLNLAKSVDFSVVQKVRPDLFQLESLFFGLAGLLGDTAQEDSYGKQLKQEYQYLEHKFELAPNFQKPAFYGLRPNNFPTIRLSQMANLYHQHSNLFSSLMAAESVSDLYKLLKVRVSTYWQTHYTFGKSSKKTPKQLTKSFIDLIIINTIVPLKFSYQKHLGKLDGEVLLDMLKKVKAEQNSIVERYDALGPKTQNAAQSQAKIQLYQHYCSKNHCLHCAVGTHLLSGNS